MHVLDPGSATQPKSHHVQAVDPAASEYESAGHGAHFSEAKRGAYVPGGHAEQTEAPASLANVPGLQPSHKKAPVLFDAAPAGHGEQLVKYGYKDVLEWLLVVALP